MPLPPAADPSYRKVDHAYPLVITTDQEQPDLRTDTFVALQTPGYRECEVPPL